MMPSLAYPIASSGQKGALRAITPPSLIRITHITANSLNEYPNNLRCSQAATDPMPPLSRSNRRSGSPAFHPSSSHKRARLDSSLPVLLPENAPYISKHDYQTHRPIFALYLEVQKQLDINDITDREMKGRWKRFVGKW